MYLIVMYHEHYLIKAKKTSMHVL